MVCKLVQFCRETKPKRIVVIVGAGHLRGMTHLLDAGIIVKSREPEEVLAGLITSESYPEGHPSLAMLPHTVPCYYP